MAAKEPLDRLVGVDLREYWTDEARDLTPWLARADNLRLLGETIGIPLEHVATERPVGPFKADLLAREAGTDNYVLIENQLEKTNHDHLGKLVTYAAGLGVKAIVWIAKEITDEHRKALEWLNEQIGKDVGFFGMELELWRIGTSRPAPKFNIIVQPNEWAIAQKGGIEEPTETKNLQYDFWRGFIDFAKSHGTSLPLRKPRPQHWYIIAIGRSGFAISLTATTREKRIGCELYIDHDDAKRAFAQLLSDRDRINAELGAELDWQELPHRHSSRIVQYREADLEDREQWPTYFGWLQERAEAFHRMFGPRVRGLDLSEPPGSVVEVDETYVGRPRST